ncbi:MAG: hypothetical protein KGD64_07560 [Candidatus Heimdallarchaeota archaeon]|nr:hypothetical protein [Candidatus Heimdallarchaeota archaeon]
MLQDSTISHCSTHPQITNKELENLLLGAERVEKQPNKFLSCPRSPYYKKPSEGVVAIFSNQQAKIVNRWMVLPIKDLPILQIEIIATLIKLF